MRTTLATLTPMMERNGLPFLVAARVAIHGGQEARSQSARRSLVV